MVKLEVWFQYKGDRASRMQTATSANNKQSEEQALFEAFDDDLVVLGLDKMRPEARVIVWGTGQIRCTWNIGRYEVSVCTTVTEMPT